MKHIYELHAEVCKTLANAKRIEIINLLRSGEKSVSWLLEKTGFTIDDMDLIEHNEAYASASIAIMRELDIDPVKFNMKGGAVALGHPIGCSGARILVTLLHALKEKGLKRGLVTLCLGGGNAVAMIVER